MKKLLSTVLVATSALALTGCGGQSHLIRNAGEAFQVRDIEYIRTYNQNHGTLVVDFMHSINTSAADIQAMADSFREEMKELELDIRINITYVATSHGNLQAEIQANMPTRDLPTLVMGMPNHFDFYMANPAPFAAGNQMIPLDSFRESEFSNVGMSNEFFEDIGLGFRNSATLYFAQGNETPQPRLMSFPFAKSGEVMVYNSSAIQVLYHYQGNVSDLFDGQAVPNFGIELDANDRWINPTWQTIWKIADFLDNNYDETLNMNRLSWQMPVLTGGRNALEPVDGEYRTVYASPMHNNRTNAQPTGANADHGQFFFPLMVDSAANFFITQTMQWGGQYNFTRTLYNNGVPTGEGQILFDSTANEEAMVFFRERALIDRFFQFGSNAPHEGNFGSGAFTQRQSLMNIGSSAGIHHSAPHHQPLVLEDGNIPTANVAGAGLRQTPGTWSGTSQYVVLPYEMGVTTVPQIDYTISGDWAMGNEFGHEATIQQGPDLAILAGNSSNATRLGAWLFIRYTAQPETAGDWAWSSGYVPISGAATEHIQERVAEASSDVHAENRGFALMIDALGQQSDRMFADPVFNGSAIARNRIPAMVITPMFAPASLGQNPIGASGQLFRTRMTEFRNERHQLGGTDGIALLPTRAVVDAITRKPRGAN